MSSDVSILLNAIQCGDSRAADELLPLVYKQLRELARAKMSQESAGQTLQATALVHEAYLRLVDTPVAKDMHNRRYFSRLRPTRCVAFWSRMLDVKRPSNEAASGSGLMSR